MQFTNISGNEYMVLALVAMAVQNPYMLEGFTLIEKESPTLSLEDAESLNNSVLNSGKGVFAKDPYSEWINPSDKIKKGLANFSSVISDVGLSHPEWGDQPFSYRQIMEDMSMEMAINVGTGYNMASALTAATCLFAHNPSVSEEMLLEKETITRKAWDLVYEDLALSQDYKRGNPFYMLLMQSVSGCQVIPPSLENDQWTTIPADQTLAKICHMFEEATGASLSSTEAKWLIWARRVVAAYKRLNRRGIDDFFNSKANKHYHTNANPNLVALFPDSKANSMLPDIIFVAIFRQLGQGLYGVNESLEEEGLAQSVWDLYPQYKDMILPHLPTWLARKFELGYLVWSNMIDQAREERKVEEVNFDGMSGYKLDAPDENFESIPYIDLHSCHAKSSYASGGVGAFEVKDWYCPITPMVISEGKPIKEATKQDLKNGEDVKFFPQSAEKAGMEVKVAGGAYWYYRNLTAKEIFERATKRYPNGVILFSENNKASYQFIRFDALLKFGAFGASKSATGISLRLVQLIIASQQYPENRPSGWDSSAAGILASITSGVRGMVNLGEDGDTTKRSKIIRLLGRSSSAEGSFATKVMTSCARRVQDHRFEKADGSTGKVPVIVFNPEDDIVKRGHFEEGQICAVSRTPMISAFFAIVKLDPDVSIGNAEVRASVFKQFTSGDGDGKP